MFGSKQRRKLAFMNIQAVTKSVNCILKPVAIANVRQNYSWNPEISSKLFSTFKMLHVMGMFNDFGCCKHLNGKKLKRSSHRLIKARIFQLCVCVWKTTTHLSGHPVFLHKLAINIPSKAPFKPGQTYTKYTLI
jgi:hypothetical protein